MTDEKSHHKAHLKSSRGSISDSMSKPPEDSKPIETALASLQLAGESRGAASTAAVPGIAASTAGSTAVDFLQGSFNLQHASTLSLAMVSGPGCAAVDFKQGSFEVHHGSTFSPLSSVGSSANSSTGPSPQGRSPGTCPKARGLQNSTAAPWAVARKPPRAA